MGLLKRGKPPFIHNSMNEDIDQEFLPPPSPSLLRQISNVGANENLFCFCLDEVTRERGNIRLGCRCVSHYGCLVNYFRVALKDRFGSIVMNRGIRCPYSTANLCLSENEYFLTPDDFDALYLYGNTMQIGVEGSGVDIIQVDEVEKYRKWFNENLDDDALNVTKGGTDLTVGMSEIGDIGDIGELDRTEQYIKATTIVCPNCGVLAGTHYHSHR